MEKFPDNIPDIPEMTREPGPDGKLQTNDDILYWKPDDARSVAITLFLLAAYIQSNLNLCGLAE